MKKFPELFSFIDSAVKNRKYAENTALGHRAALKLFEAELNSEEKDSIDLVKKNIEDIYKNVFRKNKEKLSAESLSTYKLRVLKVIGDYEKYGIDPTKISSWPSRTRKTKSSSTKEARIERGTETKVTPGIDISTDTPGSMHKIELALRPGVKFQIFVPGDISSHEAVVLKAIIDSLVTKKDATNETAIK